MRRPEGQEATLASATKTELFSSAKINWNKMKNSFQNCPPWDAKSAGLGICSSVVWANRSFFVSKRVIRLWSRANCSMQSLSCHEQREWIALNFSYVCKEQRDQDPSFLKSDKSVSLPWLFKKEGLSEERRERFTFAHKNGEKLSKTYNKMFFLEWITCFLRAIRSNHEWITDVTLFKRNWEQFVLVAL